MTCIASGRVAEGGELSEGRLLDTQLLEASFTPVPLLLQLMLLLEQVVDLELEALPLLPVGLDELLGLDDLVSHELPLIVGIFGIIELLSFGNDPGFDAIQLPRQS